MRILIDTNIIIPLEDIGINIDGNLTELSRLASGKHQLLVHPESYRDIERDKNKLRKESMLQRLQKYLILESVPELTPENEKNLFGTPKKDNDYVDNRILFSLYKDCINWLVTEDEGIHKKAKAIGSSERVLTVAQVIVTLAKIEQEDVNLFPNIDDVLCHTLDLKNYFFDSLRQGYEGFDQWFLEKCCQAGRHAWICQNSGEIHAICIYKKEVDGIVTIDNKGLRGNILKLCTFKVVKRGYKIGELLLKQAFNYAKKNNIQHIYATIEPGEHDLLRELFVDFGFYCYGTDNEGRDDVYVKDFPDVPPETNESPLDYAIKYFPTIKLSDNSVFIVPIQPQYHRILFPELERQGDLFYYSDATNSAGNAIKQAYLCKTPTNSIKPGDILFFYRTQDEMAITSYGIVDQFEIENEAEKIFQWVSKRTVYSYEEIDEMAGSNIKIILFRLVGHLDNTISFNRLKEPNIVFGPIQSVTSLSINATKKLFKEAKINDCFISN